MTEENAHLKKFFEVIDIYIYFKIKTNVSIKCKCNQFLALFTPFMALLSRSRYLKCFCS